MSHKESRRKLLKASTLAAGGLLLETRRTLANGWPSTEQTKTFQLGASSVFNILMPRDRVPLSFIIDDSTCLVNMGHFCTPQFAACYPERPEYQKDWKKWPREIPDTFVREFGEWCSKHGVKGKYSIVPNPACVGWLDRELPGWSQQDLKRSLQLVRELMLPNWDIHPEMITHTRVIDLKTGRPLESISPATMENSFPQQEISVDYLASYLAYALNILKNCGLPCEGITTPGGFGNRVKDRLPLAVQQAISDVFPEVEIPHYFKYVELDSENTEPRLEAPQVIDGRRRRFTMNVPAGTGDWFGGWQGDGLSQPDRYADQEASSGRMVQLIKSRKPAVMLCHWPGIYSNGTKEGFQAFKQVVLSIASRFADETQWMKVSEIARYWAVKLSAQVNYASDRLNIDSPHACPQFTLEWSSNQWRPTMLVQANKMTPLQKVSQKKDLNSNTFWTDDQRTILCLDLPAGLSHVEMNAAG